MRSQIPQDSKEISEKKKENKIIIPMKKTPKHVTTDHYIYLKQSVCFFDETDLLVLKPGPVWSNLRRVGESVRVLQKLGAMYITLH